MDKNLPKAREYIEETYSAIQKAMFHGDEVSFNVNVEKYEKAWLRVWQLMAKEHFKSREFEEVDMRYYRHMPDGNSFVMDSKRLGCKIKVYPRKPKDPPKDMRWMTAGELLKIHEAPIIVNIMQEFGAWFDRRSKSEQTKDRMDAVKEASIKRAKQRIKEGKGLKFKKRHKGWEIWE